MESIIYAGKIKKRVQGYLVVGINAPEFRWRDIPFDEAANSVRHAEKIMTYVQRKLS